MLRSDPDPLIPKKVWTVGTLSYASAGLVLLFLWLLFGDFAYMLRERSAAPVVQLMLKKFGASDFLTGFFMLTIPWVIIFFAGPLVSYWSDRHRGPRGRRIPFLLWPTPLVTLAMFGLAYSQQLGTALHRLMGGDPATPQSSILLVMGLAWTIFEIGVVISNAVFNGLINDVVPRELLGRFYGLFRAVGLGVGILFNYSVIGKAEEHFTLILAGIGLAYGVCFSLMCLNVKEGDYPPPPPQVPGRNPLSGVIRDYFRDCLSRPYYLWIFIFLALANSSFIPINTFSIYAAKSYGMSMDSYGKYLVVTYLFSFSLAYPLGWLADRVHPLRVGIGTLLVYALLMIVWSFWIHDAASFGAPFLVHGIVSGIFFTGTASIGQLLFPKLKFAQFAAAGGLIAALFNLSLGPTMGALLDSLGNDYKLTFLISGLIALVAAGLGLVVHRRWLACGGREAYQAP